MVRSQYNFSIASKCDCILTMKYFALLCLLVIGFVAVKGEEDEVAAGDTADTVEPETTAETEDTKDGADATEKAEDTAADDKKEEARFSFYSFTFIQHSSPFTLTIIRLFKTNTS